MLNQLKTNKASGPDGISKILKELSDIVAPILRIIFQLTLDTGIVSNNWKIANVVQIHQKGECSKPLNYRPISLTCITCKLLEHIIRSILHHATSRRLQYSI